MAGDAAFSLAIMTGLSSVDGLVEIHRETHSIFNQSLIFEGSHH